MKTMSARSAKNGFGELMDTARAEPVTIEKHGRPVVVVVSVEEYHRLCAGSGGGKSAIKTPEKKRVGGRSEEGSGSSRT